jgi:hypothetical protein
MLTLACYMLEVFSFQVFSSNILCKPISHLPMHITYPDCFILFEAQSGIYSVYDICCSECVVYRVTTLELMTSFEMTHPTM